MTGQIKTEHSQYIEMTYDMLKSWGGRDSTGFSIEVLGGDEALKLLAGVFSGVQVRFDNRAGVWHGTTTTQYKYQFLQSDNGKNYLKI